MGVSGGFPSVAVGPSLLGGTSSASPSICKQSARELLNPVQPALPRQFVILSMARCCIPWFNVTGIFSVSLSPFLPALWPSHYTSGLLRKHPRTSPPQCLLTRTCKNPSDLFSRTSPATWLARTIPLSHRSSVAIIYLRLCPLCIQISLSIVTLHVFGVCIWVLSLGEPLV